MDGSVIEDVRMHRVVFCKAITFRWFADVAPDGEGITLKLYKDRREPPRALYVRADQEISEFDGAIKDAFESVR